MSAPPIAQSTPIVPFWNRLREITRYPAHMSSMITIVMLAFGNLATFLPFGPKQGSECTFRKSTLTPVSPVSDPCFAPLFR